MTTRAAVVTACLLVPAAGFNDPVPFDFADVARLRQQLFVVQGLDSEVPPDQIGRAPTQVSLQYRIFKIVQLDAPIGLLRLSVWQRMAWKDPRLAWNESEWGGVTEIRVKRGISREGDRPDDRMWNPHIHIYNAASKLDDALDVGATWVYSDGSVYQARPGMLELNCRFTGLANFPRDDLSCPFDIGGWDYADNVMNLTFMGTGIELETLQEAGTSYQEYSLDRFTIERMTYIYPCCPNESYSNLLFRVTFQRTSMYYFWAIEFPSMLLTIVSFAVFWLDPTNCGERLGYGVTVLLAVEVTKVVTSGLLPVCGETLWVQILLILNELVCILCLLESCLAIYHAFEAIGRIDELRAERTDYHARRIVPSTYIILLGTVYSLELDDGYMGTSKSMFQGIKGASVRVDAGILIAPCVVIAVVIVWFAIQKMEGRKRDAQGKTHASKKHALKKRATIYRPAHFLQNLDQPAEETTTARNAATSTLDLTPSCSTGSTSTVEQIRSFMLSRDTRPPPEPAIELTTGQLEAAAQLRRDFTRPLPVSANELSTGPLAAAAHAAAAIAVMQAGSGGSGSGRSGRGRGCTYGAADGACGSSRSSDSNGLIHAGGAIHEEELLAARLIASEELLAAAYHAGGSGTTPARVPAPVRSAPVTVKRTSPGRLSQTAITAKSPGTTPVRAPAPTRPPVTTVTLNSPWLSRAPESAKSALPTPVQSPAPAASPVSAPRPVPPSAPARLPSRLPASMLQQDQQPDGQASEEAMQRSPKRQLVI